MKMKNLEIYDTTLRDGAQAPGISFSTMDKQKIITLLDKFGIDFIEAGNPGANPKDEELFRMMKDIPLKNSKLVAFTSTCKVGGMPQDDPAVMKTLAAGTHYVSLVGKSSLLHVEKILMTTKEENLRIIKETVSFLKSNGKSVIFDAEHFFDGYFECREYTLEVIKTADEAGADYIILCDTNGASMPHKIFDITKEITSLTSKKVGIHTHNDLGLAAAASISAANAGAAQIQGTVQGMGERCGNANLTTIIPTLIYKLGYQLTCSQNITKLCSFSRKVADIANVRFDETAPYVGANAFTHKAGMHIDAVNKYPASMEQLEPSLVGNHRHTLVSEVAGRGAILEKVNGIVPGYTKDSPEISEIMEKIKLFENKGYQYEIADASLALVILEVLGKRKKYFDLVSFKLILSEPDIENDSSEEAAALIKIEKDGEFEMNAAEGNGPVNAMDMALRKVLTRFYPEINDMRLVDYKVRVLDSTEATGSVVRVFIESCDESTTWQTLGVSTDIIKASWKALLDSVEYKLWISDKQNKMIGSNAD